MEEQGLIKELDGSRALVEVNRSALCEGCRGEKICRISPDQGTRMVWAENPISAQEGARVQISLDESRVLKGSFIVYIIPLLSLFTGAAIGKYLAGANAFSSAVKNMIGSTLGNFITNPDNMSIIVGITFLFAAFILIWLYSRRASKTGEFRPRIIKVMSESKQDITAK